MTATDQGITCKHGLPHGHPCSQCGAEAIACRTANRSESARLAGIRSMLKEPEAQTAPNNQALCWRADCEYLLIEVDMLREDLESTIPHLRALAHQCEACEGAGEIVDRDDEAQECKYCRPIWRLVERFTPKPVPAPIVQEIQDDDIPF